LIKCTGNAKKISEGRRSFPSGHASSTFGGLGYTALFLSDEFSIFGSGHAYKFMIFFIPILTAALVSISRIVDYRHHCIDVAFGAALGLISAISGYLYFSPLFSINSEKDREDLNNHIDTNTI
jgi:diacylglycerol diphosphate phosphatase / phosphatidate phosphatase